MRQENPKAQDVRLYRGIPPESRLLFRWLVLKQTAARGRMNRATTPAEIRYEQGQEHAYRACLRMARELDRKDQL